MINPLETNDAYRLSMHHETFSFIFFSYPAISSGIGSVWTEMLGEGEVGGCTFKQHGRIWDWPWKVLGWSIAEHPDCILVTNGCD